MKNIGKNVALFGGTFDPVHIGHVIIAASMTEAKNLDDVIFIPSARPPHKRDGGLLFTPEERYRLLSLAIEDTPGFHVSDIEMKREGLSYTIDTIREMKEILPPETRLSFIVGMDNLYEITLWKDPEDIVRECSILVAKRLCDKEREIPRWLLESVEIVDVPLIEVSSSDIRRRIREGKPFRFLVPDAVHEEIRRIMAGR